jgi:hypothetical protein
MASLNPLEKVCVDLYELILQHFDKSDVLNVSEVSPQWNDAISASPKCILQICLEFVEPDPVPKAIRKSKRHYNDLYVFLLNIRLNTSNESNQQKVQLVEKFAPFLKKLRIWNISKIDYEPRNLKLPKLKTLKLESYNPIVFNSVTKLKQLTLHFDRYNRSSVSWIEKQEKLEVLKLCTGKKILQIKSQSAERNQTISMLFEFK